MRPSIDLETEVHYRHQLRLTQPLWRGPGSLQKIGTALGFWMLRRLGGVDVRIEDIQALRDGIDSHPVNSASASILARK